MLGWILIYTLCFAILLYPVNQGKSLGQAIYLNIAPTISNSLRENLLEVSTDYVQAVLSMCFLGVGSFLVILILRLETSNIDLSIEWVKKATKYIIGIIVVGLVGRFKPHLNYPRVLL